MDAKILGLVAPCEMEKQNTAKDMKSVCLKKGMVFGCIIENLSSHANVLYYNSFRTGTL